MRVILFDSGSLTQRILEAELVLADQLRRRPRIAGRGKNMALCAPKVTGFAYL